MGNLISSNHSGVDLTLTFPDSQVAAFKKGDELNSPETGEFIVTNGATPLYTFTLYQGIHNTDIISINLVSLSYLDSLQRSTRSNLPNLIRTGSSSSRITPMETSLWFCRPVSRRLFQKGKASSIRTREHILSTPARAFPRQFMTSNIIGVLSSSM
ncbi:hypothetical protein F5148DRAFT_250227 [Russula earlei]|uniref:Uncharacterized protein n=1 Tax=Russula earlei TaxID=71964 RepID=A0ACC0U4N6_9AGAM|nr:hypothetical protein F5148DRAFT_250227 [Russula earlei]